MKTRIITGLVATCVLLPILIFSGYPVFPIAIAICSVLGIYEMLSCIGLKKCYALFPIYGVAAGLPFLIRYYPEDFFESASDRILAILFCTVILLSLYSFAIMVISRGKYTLRDMATAFIGCVYVLVGFNAIEFILDHEVGGNYLYLLAFLGAWITDIFAYFCGMFFGKGGKHKLIPEISPKKTVEGSIGGILFCILFTTGYGLLLDLFTDYSANLLVFAFAGLILSIISQIGDLSMSVVKRNYGIKDYGWIFPGHGGILDRFDSVLAVSQVLFVFTVFFNFLEG